MGKIIGLTFDLKSDWPLEPGESKDTHAEFDSPVTLKAVENALIQGGHTVKRIGNVDNLLQQVDSLDVDIVFNLCEGRHGRNRESQVPVLLEMKNIPFVGADALTFGITLDKFIAKKIFLANDIPTPRFISVKEESDCKNAESFQFPLIVKTRHEGSSKGISSDAFVKDMETLKNRTKVINKEYKQPALVEEFIRGSEFTVAVLGNENPKAMPVVQYCIDDKLDLGDSFYTHQHLLEGSVKYICPAKISEKLTLQLQALAVKVFESVECRDLGRVDFRVDEKGNPFVLEVNPLPSLDVEDCFSFFPKALGSSYDEAINQVLNLALKRYGMHENGKAKRENEFLKLVNAL